MERLGAAADDEAVDGVLVIFVAKHETEPGQRIVLASLFEAPA